MAAPIRQPYFTVEEYLEHDSQSPIKNEYFDGQVIAMSGVSRVHSRINSNLAGLLIAALRDRPCEVHIADMRVEVLAQTMYTYPDIAVVCEDARYTGTSVDTLLNPTVIIEVLSPSTEGYDRGTKSGYYRDLESLREYLLVSQDRMQVEQYVRQEVGWLLIEARSAEAVLHLSSIGCDLPLSEIYRRVDFGESSR